MFVVFRVVFSRGFLTTQEYLYISDSLPFLQHHDYWPYEIECNNGEIWEIPNQHGKRINLRCSSNMVLSQLRNSWIRINRLTLKNISEECLPWICDINCSSIYLTLPDKDTKFDLSFLEHLPIHGIFNIEGDVLLSNARFLKRLRTLKCRQLRAAKPIFNFLTELSLEGSKQVDFSGLPLLRTLTIRGGDGFDDTLLSSLEELSMLSTLAWDGESAYNLQLPIPIPSLKKIILRDCDIRYSFPDAWGGLESIDILLSERPARTINFPETLRELSLRCDYEGFSVDDFYFPRQLTSLVLFVYVNCDSLCDYRHRFNNLSCLKYFIDNVING